MVALMWVAGQVPQLAMCSSILFFMNTISSHRSSSSRQVLFDGFSNAMGWNMATLSSRVKPNVSWLVLELAGSWTEEGPGQCDGQTNMSPHERSISLYFIILLFLQMVLTYLVIIFARTFNVYCFI